MCLPSSEDMKNRPCWSIPQLGEEKSFRLVLSESNRHSIDEKPPDPGWADVL